MHPSTALSSSSSSSSAPTSRPQRQPNNSNARKGGLTSALQNQNQNHSQSRYQNNNSTNTPRHTQRSPEQTNFRHQSMPPQQRGYPRVDTPSESMAKLSSASLQASKSSVSDSADAGLMLRHVPQQQQQRQQRNQYPRQDSKPRPQSQPQPSKARRVQRRREIDAMTESLASVDLDMALSQSPPLNTFSPPSSSDSDDSESTLSRSNHLSGSRAYRHLIHSLPQRPSSAPAPQTHHAQRTSGISRAAVYQAYPSMEVNRADSADKAMVADRVPAEKKNALYAGPTFHNSPAPASLPIPCFTRSLGNSPVEPSAPFFGEAASPQLNSMRLQSPQQSSPNWTGHHSSTSTTPMGMHYNVHDRMATSSFVPHGAGPYGSDQLTEISQNLRMLLKIQSQ